MILSPTKTVAGRKSTFNANNTGIALDLTNGALVCSSFAARWLRWAGWQPPQDFPELPSPGELCRALGEPIFDFQQE